MTKNLKKELVAFFLGVLIGGATFYYLANYVFHNHDSHDHYALDATSDAYHIHADFIIQTRDLVHDLGTTELSSTAENLLSDSAHLHDENGSVLHMHAENYSFVEFLASLKINLTQDCLSIAGENYCNSDIEKINLFVNGALWEKSFSDYVPNDLDKVLLYYGDSNPEAIQANLNKITDDACIYSGTCPDRGIAPPESCGLTCEL
jgi:hypothetical protein